MGTTTKKVDYYHNGEYVRKVSYEDADGIVAAAHKTGASIFHDFVKESISIFDARPLSLETPYKSSRPKSRRSS